MLPRTKFLSSVDEVPGFCWDAVINTVCLTVALVPLLLHSLPTVFNRKSVDPKHPALEEETHSILLGHILSWRHFLVFKSWTFF